MSTIASIHEKIVKLVTTGGDPRTDENEARNAALQACRLIFKHQQDIAIVRNTAEPEEPEVAVDRCFAPGPYGVLCTRPAFHGGKHSAFNAEAKRRVVWKDTPVDARQTSFGWQEGVGRVVGAAVGEALRKGIGRRR